MRKPYYLYRNTSPSNFHSGLLIVYNYCKQRIKSTGFNKTNNTCKLSNRICSLDDIVKNTLFK